MPDLIFSFWAKRNDECNSWHPLLFHMVDTGETALTLWKQAFPDGTKYAFCNPLGLSCDETGRLLAFWISLHDLGKASPVFQRKFEPHIQLLRAEGLKFPLPSPNPASHGVITSWSVQLILSHYYGVGNRVLRRIARVLGGHHGRWPTSIDFSPTQLTSADKGDSAWDDARHSLVKTVRDIFQPPMNFRWPVDILAENTLLTLLSGFTSIADWIASNNSFFVFEPSDLGISKYINISEIRSKQALEQLGWLGWKPKGDHFSFSQIFSFNPYQIQEKVIAEAQNLELPALVILEAPTGIGKTEMALYIADYWLQKSSGRGIYIAMPSQATSNQMYGRVETFLRHRYPTQTLNLHLIHGSALLAEKSITAIDISDDENNATSGNVRAESWFQPRKKTLLAPFGVGTVDQALLSVLQTRHFFVRLFGLGQKIVIFDEIHAYDTYMSVLFRQLLHWMRAIGSSVILLSATLPESVRRDLLVAWTQNDNLTLPSNSYPRLSLASGGDVTVVPLPSPPPKIVQINPVEENPQAILDHLRKKLGNGGCVAVICNRVARAVEIFETIQRAGIVNDDNLILFHARYPFNWRKEIEERILSLFSKGGQRPKKAIVVATQVIEQSLDLDFDYLISDIAPIDLLLQRMGRLHRHSQNDCLRQNTFPFPEMGIAQPPLQSQIPNFGSDGYIYDIDILLQTWNILRGKTQITIPAETDSLIEAVYSREPKSGDDELNRVILEARRISQQEHDRARFEAVKRMIPQPNDEELINCENENLEEEDPRIHEAFRALTRLSEPGISLICLWQTSAGLALDADGTGAPLNMDIQLDQASTKYFLQRTVTVQDRRIVNYYLRQGAPKTWQKSSALRNHYLAVFDDQGRCPLEGTSTTIILNRLTGLSIKEGA